MAGKTFPGVSSFVAALNKANFRHCEQVKYAFNMLGAPYYPFIPAGSHAISSNLYI